MTAYYNEIDEDAASELRKLIVSGRIAAGDVDSRSIAEVSADDLRGYTQAHFFAGIGGWSLGLRIARWPDDRPIWTGSCPCQPFSLAGKRRGFEDKRHLWPEWFRLIRECAPTAIFGEQVAHAKAWLALVKSDLERSGFAFASRKLKASDIGAPHRRARLWFLADADSKARWLQQGGRDGARREDQAVAGSYGEAWAMADALGVGQREPTIENLAVAGGREARPVSSGNGKPMADADSIAPLGPSIAWAQRDPWSSEPAVGRVVDGIPHRLVEPALRLLGNAIVPKCAAEFIIAADEAMTDTTNENLTP